MVPPDVQWCVAQLSVTASVLATSTLLADRKQQAVAKAAKEVGVRHSTHALLVGQEEGPSTRSAVGAGVGGIILGESAENGVALAGADLVTPDTLQLGGWLVHPSGATPRSAPRSH